MIVEVKVIGNQAVTVNVTPLVPYNVTVYPQAITNVVVHQGLPGRDGVTIPIPPAQRALQGDVTVVQGYSIGNSWSSTTQDLINARRSEGWPDYAIFVQDMGSVDISSGEISLPLILTAPFVSTFEVNTAYYGVFLPAVASIRPQLISPVSIGIANRQLTLAAVVETALLTAASLSSSSLGSFVFPALSADFEVKTPNYLALAQGVGDLVLPIVNVNPQPAVTGLVAVYSCSFTLAGISLGSTLAAPLLAGIGNVVYPAATVMTTPSLAAATLVGMANRNLSLPLINALPGVAAAVLVGKTNVSITLAVMTDTATVTTPVMAATSAVAFGVFNMATVQESATLTSRTLAGIGNVSLTMAAVSEAATVTTRTLTGASGVSSGVFTMAAVATVPAVTGPGFSVPSTETKIYLTDGSHTFATNTTVHLDYLNGPGGPGQDEHDSTAAHVGTDSTLSLSAVVIATAGAGYPPMGDGGDPPSFSDGEPGGASHTAAIVGATDVVGGGSPGGSGAGFHGAGR